MPKGYTYENGYFCSPEGREVLGITQPSIWKQGKASSRLFFARNAFDSKEKLSLVMAHEFGHVIHFNLGLHDLASQASNSALRSIDNEGHIAIQKMTYELINKNGWAIPTIQVPAHILQRYQTYPQLYDPLQGLIKKIRFP